MKGGCQPPLFNLEPEAEARDCDAADTDKQIGECCLFRGGCEVTVRHYLCLGYSLGDRRESEIERATGRETRQGREDGLAGRRERQGKCPVSVAAAVSLLNAVVVPVCVIVGKPNDVPTRFAPAGNTRASASTNRIPYAITLLINYPPQLLKVLLASLD